MTLIPFNTHNKLVELVSATKKSFVIMGRLLGRLKEEDNYLLTVGSGINSWQDYLAQPEVGLTVGEANRMIQIYDELIIRLGFSEDQVSDIGKKNLNTLLPIVKNMETIDEAEEIVADAIFLSTKDFKEKVYEVKHPEIDQTYEYILHKKSNETGNMSRVHEVTHEDIISKFNL